MVAPAAELERDALAVVAFRSDAALLLGLGDEIRPSELLDTMLRIPAQGLANVAFPLRPAARQLAAVPERGARVLLLAGRTHHDIAPALSDIFRA
ncbi:hypothetical protein ACL02R_25470 [Streptomyces sp. MS19]|uniref:hypothetical protein n=1 Tax=Streptomyces sp. MS19 TaxID=3385972 RepID=UPI00399FB148